MERWRPAWDSVGIGILLLGLEWEYSTWVGIILLMELESELWHSKADKIVNNFHGQNRFQFHGQIPIFYGQNSHFCCQNWFFNVQTYKFSRQIIKYLGHKISWSISIPFQCQNFMLNPIPFQFYAQLRSIPTAFHGQSRFHESWAVTVSIYLHPMSATPSCLTSVSFECSLGTVTILHQWCRI